MPDHPGDVPLSGLSRHIWDVLVVGGGIVGAGVFREAARAGLRVLLLEKNDFASGTSGRSSKLVHGGLHYLVRGQLRLALRSRRERRRLLKSGDGLVRPLRFQLSPDVLEGLPPWVREALLAVYTGGNRKPLARTRRETLKPTERGLRGFYDGQVDDARLVLRVLREGRARGGTAANYADVERLTTDTRDQPAVAVVQERRTGRRFRIQARVVVSAVGYWSDDLNPPSAAFGRTEGLRGSHLVFPARRLPLAHAVASIHRRTGRPIYALPWGTVTLVGSTSVPHLLGPDTEPVITNEEVKHLLAWTRASFPGQRIGYDDIQATFSGVRAIPGPQVGSRLSHSSREEAVRRQPGLITVIGGKLTTFHATARRALRLVMRELDLPDGLPASPALDPLPVPWPGLPFDAVESRRLMASYGADGLEYLAGAPPAERHRVPGLGMTTAEIGWVCSREQVRHLHDLLGRRFRTALLTPLGGLPWISGLRDPVCTALGWSATRWEEEVTRYRSIWRVAHSPPRPRSGRAAGHHPSGARLRAASA